MLKILTGGMYASKSTELLKLYQRNKYAKKKALLFNNLLDTRYGINVVSTHTREQEDAYAIKDEKGLFEVLAQNLDVKKIYIDEFQFFSAHFANKIIELSENGYDITVAGLDLTFDNQPFISMKTIFPYADEIIKLKAVCHVCGCDDANKSFRLSDSENEVEVGSDGKYVALCTYCYNEQYKKDVKVSMNDFCNMKKVFEDNQIIPLDIVESVNYDIIYFKDGDKHQDIHWHIDDLDEIDAQFILNRINKLLTNATLILAY